MSFDNLGGQKRSTGPITKSKDMTPLDEVTHNFTGDPAIRQYFIEKYGQCFEKGVRHTA